MPYPSNEKYAAEAIFDYATTVLGFREEDIVLYAWSIGGYPASYLAARHSKVKGLVSCNLAVRFDKMLKIISTTFISNRFLMPRSMTYCR